MKVVWLHGPPAAGKLTVAKVLHTDHAFKLFHNHLAVDISLAIYDEFGEKDFFSFTNSVRRQVLSKANSLGVMHLVMTYMTCAEKDDPQIKEYLTFFAQENIEVYPIHLRPGNDELLSRVTSAGRINTYKISSVSKLSEFLLDKHFQAIQHPNTLTIDNSELSPKSVASLIIDHIQQPKD